MKFRLIEECEPILLEKLDKLTTNTFITESEISLRDFIISKPDLYRVLYDSRIEKYMIGKAYDLTHYELFREARDQGYYYSQEDFIEDELGDFENYWDTGLHGGEEYSGDEIEPYLFSLILIPYSEDKNEFNERVEFAESDGYQNITKFDNINYAIACRDFTIEEIPLYSYLINRK